MMTTLGLFNYLAQEICKLLLIVGVEVDKSEHELLSRFNWSAGPALKSLLASSDGIIEVIFGRSRDLRSTGSAAEATERDYMLRNNSHPRVSPWWLDSHHCGTCLPILVCHQ